MATPRQWIAGARPRTLPAAAAPVFVGTGAAAQLDSFHAGAAALALLVGRQAPRLVERQEPRVVDVAGEGRQGHEVPVGGVAQLDARRAHHHHRRGHRGWRVSLWWIQKAQPSHRQHRPRLKSSY